jgi:hypothetical protein
MDVMRARVELRERPLLDVLDLAVRFCAEHASAYAKLSLVVVLPSFAASWLAARLGGWWLGWAVTVALTSFATAPYVVLASRLVFADVVRVREALGVAARATPKLIGLRLVQAMSLAGSALLLGVPWLWVGTIWVFAVEVLVLEQPGLGQAFGRAMRIANAHFGVALLTMLLLGLAPLATAMLADVAGREAMQSVFEVRPPPSMFQAGGSWMAFAGWWVMVPIVTTARFLVYIDIRTRTEGWDIQTRFAAIAARAASETQDRAA